MKKLEIRVEEDTTPYGKHDGWSVGLYADDVCIFATTCASKTDAEQTAKKKRALLGLEKLYQIQFTCPPDSGYDSGTNLHVLSFGTLLEASAWANANAPKGCTRISVEET